MRLLAPLLLLSACTTQHVRRPFDSEALRGVTIGIPAPSDVRPTPGVGCGMLAQDLALRTHKMLIGAFSDAGANATNASSGPWVLTIALREATRGRENQMTRRTDKPVIERPPGGPQIDAPQQSWFNSGMGNVIVVLDSTLAHDGAVIWRETITGHAESAPCVQAVDKVHEALGDAVDEVRDRVIRVIKR